MASSPDDLAVLTWRCRFYLQSRDGVSVQVVLRDNQVNCSPPGVLPSPFRRATIDTSKKTIRHITHAIRAVSCGPRLPDVCRPRGSTMAVLHVLILVQSPEYVLPNDEEEQDRLGVRDDYASRPQADLESRSPAPLVSPNIWRFTRCSSPAGPA